MQLERSERLKRLYALAGVEGTVTGASWEGNASQLTLTQLGIREGSYGVRQISVQESQANSTRPTKLRRLPKSYFTRKDRKNLSGQGSRCG